MEGVVSLFLEWKERKGRSYKIQASAHKFGEFMPAGFFSIALWPRWCSGRLIWQWLQMRRKAKVAAVIRVQGDKHPHQTNSSKNWEEGSNCKSCCRRLNFFIIIIIFLPSVLQAISNIPGLKVPRNWNGSHIVNKIVKVEKFCINIVLNH